jgi:hypothetical protein
MSSRKYHAGILAGCASSRTPGGWPASVPGFGDMAGGLPLAQCFACPPDEHPAKASTFVRYGGRPLCKACALKFARSGGEDELPFVAEALRRATCSEPEGTRGDQHVSAATDGPRGGQGRLIPQPQPRVPSGPERK